MIIFLFLSVRHNKTKTKNFSGKFALITVKFSLICSAIGCTLANIYKYLADIPKRAVLPKQHLKYKKSIKKGDLCNCGNQAVDTFGGKLICRKCMCPDYQHDLKIYQDGNLALEINNRFHG